jgi:hypothetical protein
VTNAELNNGVVRYVEPFDDDRVFDGPAICISGLGHATVHFSRFLPKGNGGDSCTVLKPLTPMANVALIYYGALFNTLQSWRFSFGRKANKTRLERLDLAPVFAESPIDLRQELGRANREMADLLTRKEQQLLSA